MTRVLFALAAATFATLRLEIVLPPATARSGALQGSSSTASDTISTATPSDSSWTPSSKSLVRIRSRVGQGGFRLWVGRDGYEIRRAQFDPSGVVFETSDQEGISTWSEGEKIPPRPLPTPIAWSHIDRIAVHRPAFIEGALAGAFLSLAALVVWDKVDPDLQDSGLFWPAVPATGAGGGALVGTIHGRWHLVWKRPAQAVTGR